MIKYPLKKIDSFYTTVASKLVEKLSKVLINLESSSFRLFTDVKVSHVIVIHFQWFQKTNS